MSFLTSLQQLVSDASSSLSESARKLVHTSSKDSTANGSEGDDNEGNNAPIVAGAASPPEPPKVQLQLPNPGGRNSLTSSTLQLPTDTQQQQNQRRRSSLFVLPVALGGSGGGGDDQTDASGNAATSPSWTSKWLQPSTGAGSSSVSPGGGPATWDTSPGGLSRSRRNSSVR